MTISGILTFLLPLILLTGLIAVLIDALITVITESMFGEKK